MYLFFIMVSVLFYRHRPTPVPFSFLSLRIRLLAKPRVSGITRYSSSYDWFISLSIMSSRALRAAACDGLSFLLKTE